MTRRWRRKPLALMLTLATLLIGCASREGAPTQQDLAQGSKKTYEDLVVGFAQIGAESEWRTANTASLREEAERLGVELKLSDAQQQQENQIKTIRSFIAQRVDVIGLSPIVETGWETVFKEVKDAGIPLILLDRHASVSEDLYSAFIGSDFRLEGESACKEMIRLLDGEGAIVELEGTIGSAPAIDRKTGFHECLKGAPGITVLASQSGDFIRAEGKEIMTVFLKRYGNTITGLYAHNDDMALGAIQAIEEYGLRPGVDIKIVSVDAVRSAFEAMVAGKLNVTVECNPLLGPQFFETALKLANGEPVDKWVKSKEGIYRMDTAAQELPKRRY